MSPKAPSTQLPEPSDVPQVPAPSGVSVSSVRKVISSLWRSEGKAPAPKDSSGFSAPRA